MCVPFRFEKASPDGKGFERHVRDDHNLWGYLAFLVHMSLKVVLKTHIVYEENLFCFVSCLLCASPDSQQCVSYLDTYLNDPPAFFTIASLSSMEVTRAFNSPSNE